MNGVDLVSQNAQITAQHYSQAIKLRIEYARQQRGASLPHGVDNDLNGIQNVGHNITCECEAPTFAVDDILASFLPMA